MYPNDINNVLGVLQQLLRLPRRRGATRPVMVHMACEAANNTVNCLLLRTRHGEQNETHMFSWWHVQVWCHMRHISSPWLPGA